MGFGYLFFGAVLWINPLLSAYTEWAAYLFMLAGNNKLAFYNRGFRCSRIAAVSGLLLSFLRLIPTAAEEFGLYAFSEGILYPIISTAVLLNAAVYVVFLMIGIFQIAGETGLEKLKTKAVYRAGLHTRVILFETVVSLGILENAAGDGSMTVILVAKIFVKILVALLVFSCYRMICLEGEEEMSRKESRFAFVNRLNEHFDRKEEENLELARREREERRKKKQQTRRK